VLDSDRHSLVQIGDQSLTLTLFLTLFLTLSLTLPDLNLLLSFQKSLMQSAVGIDKFYCRSWCRLLMLLVSVTSAAVWHQKGYGCVRMYIAIRRIGLNGLSKYRALLEWNRKMVLSRDTIMNVYTHTQRQNSLQNSPGGT